MIFWKILEELTYYIFPRRDLPGADLGEQANDQLRAASSEKWGGCCDQINAGCIRCSSRKNEQIVLISSHKKSRGHNAVILKTKMMPSKKEPEKAIQPQRFCKNQHQDHGHENLVLLDAKKETSNAGAGYSIPQTFYNASVPSRLLLKWTNLHWSTPPLQITGQFMSFWFRTTARSNFWAPSQSCRAAWLRFALSEG